MAAGYNRIRDLVSEPLAPDRPDVINRGTTLTGCSVKAVPRSCIADGHALAEAQS